MMIRNEGVRIAPWLRSMLLASVLNLGMPDARMRPRGDRFYRPPAAAPLSLQPNGHLSATIVAEAGRHWLPLAWPRRAQHRYCVWCHCRRHGDAWGALVHSRSYRYAVGYISNFGKPVSFPKEGLAASLVVGTVRRLSAPQLTLPWPKRHAADLTHRVRTSHDRSRRARPP